MVSGRDRIPFRVFWESVSSDSRKRADSDPFAFFQKRRHFFQILALFFLAFFRLKKHCFSEGNFSTGFWMLAIARR